MMFLKSTTIKSRLFKTWLISYFLIFIIPLVIGAFIYNKSEGIILRETINTNMQMLRQVKATSDLKLEEIDHLMIQIALNNKVNQFISVGPNLNENQRYLAAQIVNDLFVYKNSNDFIENFYIYFKNSDCVLSPLGKYSTNEIFNEIGIAEKGNITDLDGRILGKRYTRQIFNGILQNDGEEKKEILLYIQTLPLTTHDTVCSVIIVIDKAKLSSIFEEFSRSQKYLLFIDENNNILFMNDESYNNDVSYEELSMQNGMFLKNADNEKHIFFMRSDVLDFKYVVAVMLKQLTEQVGYIRNITIISSLMCSIFASIMSFIFAKHRL